MYSTGKQYGQLGRVGEYSYFRLKYTDLALAQKVFDYARANTPQVAWNKYYDVTSGKYKVEIQGYIATTCFNTIRGFKKPKITTKSKQLKLGLK